MEIFSHGKSEVMQIEIEEGMHVVARGKAALIVGPVDADSVEVLLLSTRQKITVGLNEIEFITVPKRSTGDSELLYLTRLESESNDQEIQLALRRHEVLSRLHRKEISVAQAAEEIGVTRSHVYKLRAKHDESMGYCTQLVRRRGNQRNSRHLDPALEKEIEAVLETFRKRAGVTFAEVWRAVQKACMSLNLKCPARKTIRNRMKNSFTREEVTRLKYGREVAAQMHDSRPGKYKATKPLEWVQTDHTLVDYEVLTDDRSDTIGRPWLTLFIDVYTRVILGYYLSLHPPSTLSVACALTHAVMPKEDFLRRLNLSGFKYPMYGPPFMVYMDNAKEYRSHKYLSSLDRAHIGYDHRPLGKKHFGGHVERLIGTMMNKVHLLSGSTMSNTVVRKRLARDRKPTQTFTEFARWFALEVMEYHSTVHSEIKKTPLQAWQDYYGPHGVVPFPPQITDAHQFRLNFMPQEYRNIRPGGIEFKTRFYWDPVLDPFIEEKKVLIKYDPFSLKQIWVQLDGQFIPIPFADMTLPDITLEEHRAKVLSSQSLEPGSFGDAQAAEAHSEAGRIESASIKKTRAAKKQLAAKVEYQKEFSSAEVVKKEKKVAPDYSLPPKPFKGGV
ncbi:hypothetical protein C1X73_18275 [Pseudomonas sp. FW305-130]|jgi:putative transposase|nr:hypothetical protein C1X74_19310 [Pseudomonas sp. GW460-5]PNB56744.1 hypothetical protein C1X73_18275 [Pseudomonas sp. FW305-130]